MYQVVLSLMTAKNTVEWMKEHRYYKHWLLLENVLHEIKEVLKTYVRSQPGDTPKLMVWDASLNHDIDSAVDHHVTPTQDGP